jgi:hypothetical protein
VFSLPAKPAFSLLLPYACQSLPVCRSLFQGAFRMNHATASLPPGLYFSEIDRKALDPSNQEQISRLKKAANLFLEPKLRVSSVDCLSHSA